MTNIRRKAVCLISVLAGIGMLFASGRTAKACTGIDFSVSKGKLGVGNYVFSGRTMEFGPDVTSWKLLYTPRGSEYTSCRLAWGLINTCGKDSAKNVLLGYKWKSSYAYVGFTPMRPIKNPRNPGKPVEITLKEITDGINEKGLYCGGFYHMGTESYSTAAYALAQHNVSDMDFVAWVLGQFASVEELKKQLATPGAVFVRQFDVSLFDKPVTDPSKFPQLHYKVVDRTGAAIIIEFVDGMPKVFDSMGVITNNPTYDWQTTNLRNYVGLQTGNHESTTFMNKTYVKISNGTGGIGLPGDFTSPSRFIRAAYLLNATLENNTIQSPEEAVLRGFRILNQFDIPEGSVVETDPQTQKVTMEATSWTSMADLWNLRYYYHTMNSRTIRMISLGDLINKSISAVSTIDLPANELILDVTKKFK